MKAERRHELQTNTLAQTLSGAPEFWRKHGTKVLVALVVLISIVLLIQYRMNAKTKARTEALKALANAQEGLAKLSHPNLVAQPPANAINEIRALSVDIADNLTKVMDLADQPAVKAEGFVAQGDFFLKLALLPELPGASTQPALRLDSSRDDNLKKAEESYRQVLDNRDLLMQRASAITAHFGMAAIDETRGDFNKAREHYLTINNDESAPNFLRTFAANRINNDLPAMQAQIALGATTRPAVIDPATQPTTAPATMPAK